MKRLHEYEPQKFTKSGTARMTLQGRVGKTMSFDDEQQPDQQPDRIKPITALPPEVIGAIHRVLGLFLALWIVFGSFLMWMGSQETIWEILSADHSYSEAAAQDAAAAWFALFVVAAVGWALTRHKAP